MRIGIRLRQFGVPGGRGMYTRNLRPALFGSDSELVRSHGRRSVSFAHRGSLPAADTWPCA
jgi:hypothetical protein